MPSVECERLDSPALQRIVDEDAIGQLRRREGEMRVLGSEVGVPRLDWVDAVERLLAHPEWIDAVEQEAEAIRQRGIRHVIWTGMGGSVGAVRVLAELLPASDITIHPLDSTDPAALNDLIQALADAHGIRHGDDPAALPALLSDVLIVGVAMGMTSEEPLTHLEWFTELLDAANLPANEHVLVMALPDSLLDRFVREHALPQLPIQLDGGSGTGGRMSAPGTRVFLLPAALLLPGTLRAVLSAAWQEYDLADAEREPAAHPAVRLAAAAADASRAGILYLELTTDSPALFDWIEQVVEESLGKGGKGIVVFTPDGIGPAQFSSSQPGVLSVAEMVARDGDPAALLTSIASAFLRWQLTVALYGYLHGIPFAGQPAVEAYKARARQLRALPDPLAAAESAGVPRAFVNHELVVLPSTPGTYAVDTLVAMLDAPTGDDLPPYLDVTINGALPWRAGPGSLYAYIEAALSRIAHAVGVPYKLRRAPAAYHATEQSEMDGPPLLLSLRVCSRHVQSPRLGSYSPTFLAAQATGTWLAMVEAGRPCVLLILELAPLGGYPDVGGMLHEVADRVAESDVRTR